MRILILGGYGNTGRPLATALLQETAVHLVLAGRNLNRAQNAADQFNQQWEGQRVSAAFCDAADPNSLQHAFETVDIVVVASSTSLYARNVASAALTAGIDYVDVQYAAEKTAVLQSMSAAIADAGCCFITDGGFHPGLPAALVRFVTPYFDHLESANISSVIKINWRALTFAPETIVEFVGEFLDMEMKTFADGRWQQSGWWDLIKPRTFQFDHGFGEQSCVPMFLEEMRSIPDCFPAIRETGFYVGGFNKITDWIVSPLVMLVLKAAPRRGQKPMGRLFLWSLKRFSRPPYGTLLKLEARGIKENRPQAIDITLFHEDGYILTAVPVAATLLQLIDGTRRQPGLHCQAHIVEPVRLLQDMERMGIEIQIRHIPEITAVLPSEAS